MDDEPIAGAAAALAVLQLQAFAALLDHMLANVADHACCVAVLREHYIVEVR